MSKSKQLQQYIRDKHTQEECVGFIDGWDKAEEYFFTNKVSKMEEAITEVLDLLTESKGVPNTNWIERRLRDSL